MSTENRQLAAAPWSVDPRWRDMYRIGGVATMALAVGMALAVIAYFIWPYTPGFVSAEKILRTMHADRMAGLVSLDLFLVVCNLMSIPFLVSLYVALRRTNESLALIAMIVGLISVIVIIPARPLSEIVGLSDRLAAAATDAEKNRLMAAGEALLALFNGTSWMVFYVFSNVAGLLNGILMLRNPLFGKPAAVIGIVASVAAFGVFIPAAGIVFGLAAMPGGIAFAVLVSVKLMKAGFGRDASA